MRVSTNTNNSNISNPSSSPRLPSPPPFTEVQVDSQSDVTQVDPSSPPLLTRSLSSGSGGRPNISPKAPTISTTAPYAGATSSTSQSTITRRIRPGSKAREISTGPPLIPLSELDSAFQLQEHLASILAAATTASEKSSGNIQETDDSGTDTDDDSTYECSIPLTRGACEKVAEPPEGVDEWLWCYELTRRVTKDLNILIVALLNDGCTAQSCPQMRASEWQYLCAVHDTPQSCCAINYSTHTLDHAATLLTSTRYFPSRLSLNATGTKHLSSIFRRLYRIFAHAWFQHNRVFWEVESEYGLYVFFKTISERYGLIPEDNLTIPPEAEARSGSSFSNSHGDDMDEFDRGPSNRFSKHRKDLEIRSSGGRDRDQEKDRDIGDDLDEDDEEEDDDDDDDDDDEDDDDDDGDDDDDDAEEYEGDFGDSAAIATATTSGATASDNGDSQESEKPDLDAPLEKEEKRENDAARNAGVGATQNEQESFVSFSVDTQQLGTAEQDSEPDLVVLVPVENEEPQEEEVNTNEREWRKEELKVEEEEQGDSEDKLILPETPPQQESKEPEDEGEAEQEEIIAKIDQDIAPEFERASLENPVEEAVKQLGRDDDISDGVGNGGGDGGGDGDLGDAHCNSCPPVAEPLHEKGEDEESKRTENKGDDDNNEKEETERKEEAMEEVSKVSSEDCGNISLPEASS